MFFKKLLCHHDITEVIKFGEWFPTFHTTNGLDNEDERDIIVKCTDCGKRIALKQIRSYGTIMNLHHLVEKADSAS